jgi:hypothetical protein
MKFVEAFVKCLWYVCLFLDNNNVTVIPPAKYFDGITRLRGCGFYERG